MRRVQREDKKYHSKKIIEKMDKYGYSRKVKSFSEIIKQSYGIEKLSNSNRDNLINRFYDPEDRYGDSPYKTLDKNNSNRNGINSYQYRSIFDDYGSADKYCSIFDDY